MTLCTLYIFKNAPRHDFDDIVAIGRGSPLIVFLRRHLAGARDVQVGITLYTSKVHLHSVFKIGFLHIILVDYRALSRNLTGDLNPILKLYCWPISVELRFIRLRSSKAGKKLREKGVRRLTLCEALNITALNRHLFP